MTVFNSHLLATTYRSDCACQASPLPWPFPFLYSSPSPKIKGKLWCMFDRCLYDIVDAFQCWIDSVLELHWSRNEDHVAWWNMIPNPLVSKRLKQLVNYCQTQVSTSCPTVSPGSCSWARFQTSQGLVQLERHRQRTGLKVLLVDLGKAGHW